MSLNKRAKKSIHYPSVLIFHSFVGTHSFFFLYTNKKRENQLKTIANFIHSDLVSTYPLLSIQKILSHCKILCIRFLKRDSQLNDRCIVQAKNLMYKLSGRRFFKVSFLYKRRIKNGIERADVLMGTNKNKRPFFLVFYTKAS